MDGSFIDFVKQHLEMFINSSVLSKPSITNTRQPAGSKTNKKKVVVRNVNSFGFGVETPIAESLVAFVT